MPKSKEYVSSDDDSSEEEVKPKKKQKKSDEKEEKSTTSSKKPEKMKKESRDNEETSWELGNNRQIKVREFKGRTFVDIREMYLKDGDFLPGKKGICLSIPQWRKLMSVVEEVDEEVKKKC